MTTSPASVGTLDASRNQIVAGGHVVMTFGGGRAEARFLVFDPSS